MSWRGAAFLVAASLVGCAPGVMWVRPERTAGENRADYAACQDATYRRLRMEFGPEIALSGGSVPGFASENPIPNVPQPGSVARSRPDDPFLRQDIDSARTRADFRRQQLMRNCLEQAGFHEQEEE